MTIAVAVVLLLLLLPLIDEIIVCSVDTLNGVLNANVEEVLDNCLELCSFEYLTELLDDVLFPPLLP